MIFMVRGGYGDGGHQIGIPLARIRVARAAQIETCNAYSSLDLPVKLRPCSWEYRGSADAVAEQSLLFARLLK